MDIVIDLRNVKEYLDGLENAREVLIKRGRDILGLCRTIITKSVLNEDTENYVNELKRIFAMLYNDIKHYPELLYSNIFYSIATEYVEALQLRSIIKNQKILSLEDMGVHPIPYLLGLADVVGELKRISLELMRKNKFDESYRLLEIAEELYKNLSSIDYPNALLPGFRRKLDIIRKVLDDWKKFLIDMDSRKSLIQNIRRLSASLEHREAQEINL